ncbi:MAG TPA: hypothetical protein PLQ76_09945, partial [bacterium]|nr:hypothetical protein [bacterium]
MPDSAYLIPLLIKALFVVTGVVFGDSPVRIPQTYFFMAFFVPSFVLMISVVVYFIAYFLLIGVVAAVLNGFAAVRTVPLVIKIASAIVVAAVAYAAGKFLRKMAGKGDVINLKRLEKSHTESFGEKAVSIGFLNSVGLRTPVGFGVSERVFERYARRNGIG